MLEGAKHVTLRELVGDKPLVINFWASWCTYCIAEMPDFQRVYARASGAVGFVGLDLLGVQGETRQAAVALARSTGVRYPLAFDQGGELYARVVPRLLMPTTILVRADGIVAARQFGPVTDDELIRLIRTDLGVAIDA